MTEEEKEKLINKLYYSYLDNDEAQKVIDYIIKLEQENQQLKQQLEQRDNIINKVREIIDKFYISNNFVVYDNNDITKAIIELFKILNIDKGE